MKSYFWILAVGLLLSGCENVSKDSLPIQAKKLEVDAGKDLTISIGISIKITGHAKSLEGDIITYQWKENDTELSSEPELIIDSLSEGDHILKFEVEDNNGNRNSDEIIISVIPEKEILIQEYLDIVNEARSQPRDCKNGRGVLPAANPVKWSDGIYLAALEHSKDMALSNTYEHEGSGTQSDITGYEKNKKSTHEERIERHTNETWEYSSENIIAGAGSVEKMMDKWLNSPSHCANIMHEEWTHFAMATYRNDNSKWVIYWTQNFAKVVDNL